MHPVPENRKTENEFYLYVNESKSTSDDLEQRVHSCRRKIFLFVIAFVGLGTFFVGTCLSIGQDSTLKTILRLIMTLAAAIFCWEKYIPEIQNFIKAKEELKRNET